MAAPWEKYAAQAPDSAPQGNGPWSKYGGGEVKKSEFSPQAFVEGGAQSALAGYLPEVQAAVGGLMPNPSAKVDAELRAKGTTINQPEDTYASRLAENRGRLQGFAENSPKSYYGGQIAGAIGTAPIYGAGLKAAGLASEIPAAAEGSGLLGKAGNFGARMGQTGAQGAALGALTNPHTEGSDESLDMGDRLKNSAISGLFGAALPVAGTVVKGAAGAVKAGAVKGLSMLGVAPGTISEYLQFSDRINAAPTLEKLKDVSDEYVGKLSEDVSDKKLSVDQAQDAFKALHTDLTNKYQTEGLDARAALASAQQTLKDAHLNSITQTAQDVSDTIQNLRQEVVEGSRKSYDILGTSKDSMPTAPIKRQVTMLMNNLKIAGKTPIGGDASQAVNQLQTIRDQLNQVGKTIPLTEVKKMVQQLQTSTSYGQNAAQFSEAGDKAIKVLSQGINNRLKTGFDVSEPYAEQMGKVASNTGLLSDVGEFADNARGGGFLKNIENPTNVARKSALQQLGNKYNADFVGAVNPENLPEQKLVTGAQNKLDTLRPDRVKEAIANQSAASPEAAKLSGAQGALEKSKEALAPFKSLAPNAADQTQTQQKLAQLAKGKNIELTDMFDKLGKLTDTDFVQAMHDQHIQEAFKKNVTNGSRNTVFGAVVGGAFGGLGGAAAGAAFGRNILDIYGPKVTKVILDGAIKVAKNPTVQTIANLQVPDEVKQHFATALSNYMANQRLGEKKNGRTSPASLPSDASR